MSNAPQTHNQQEFSVSEISLILKRRVEESFGFVRIRGEISGFKRAASGHIYFSLKDENAVISAVCWKGVSSRFKFNPEDGIEVICTGGITTYPGRSQYQLVVENMEPAGAGALMALLEKRKKQLAAEGLFDPARKKPIPFLPKTIGVVTSPTGAVIKDILHRLRERFPVHVLLWPVLVQGEGAAEQIANAINGFNNLPDDIAKPDVIIVARGGGSLEDLWAFNEEIVVRAAASSKIPLISAVGHETDTTLIDFASDKRAPTPTAAAEMAVPVRNELLAYTYDMQARMAGVISRIIREKENFLGALMRGLISPSQLLGNMAQRLDDWSERLADSLPKMLEKKMREMQVIISGLISPSQLLGNMAQRLDDWSERLADSLPKMLEKKMREMQIIISGLKPQNLLRLIEIKENKLSSYSQLLESYHYKKVLMRGFALVRDGGGKLITSSTEITAGMNLDIEFKDGRKSAVADGGKKKDTGQKSLF